MKFVLVQREVVPRPGRGRVGVGSGLVLNLMTAQLRLSRSITLLRNLQHRPEQNEEPYSSDIGSLHLMQKCEI